MTTIHLTDAQRDTFAACNAIVIDGDICPTCHGYPNIVTVDDDCNITSVTPKPCCAAGGGLVAPEGWRILTEPCDDLNCTAGWHCGCGYGIAHVAACGRPVPPCPSDCVGGRRVVTFTAKSRDYTIGGEYVTVELGRFTIPALLPIVPTVPAIASHDPIEGPPVVFTDEAFPRELFIRHDGLVDSLGYLDPLPRPGQFIARPEPVP